MKTKTPTILVVDDTETNIDILIDLLSNDYDVMVALDGQGALDIANEDKIDLILLDIVMPGMNGYEVCKTLKAVEKTKEIPVIFITAKTDEDSIEKAYDIGGIDYVTKPFKPKELLARIKTQLKLKSLINHLIYISSHDPMTGIYNRRKFFALSEDKFITQKENLYAIMIDIDKFKLINDTYGHPLGDKVIKKVTQTISKHLSDKAIFGRIGGEEFAIVGNHPSFEGIIEDIEFTRKTIEKLVVIADNGDSVKFTISIGIVKSNINITTLDDLLKLADSALYEAKGTGRNKSIFRD